MLGSRLVQRQLLWEYAGTNFIRPSTHAHAPPLWRSSCKGGRPHHVSVHAMSWLWTFGQVPELEAAQLHAVVKAREAGSSQAVIIDVRTAQEWQGGHIAGAVNASFLPPWSFGERVTSLVQGLPKDAEIYLICLSAHRSIGALKWLRGQGYTNVKQLQGGMKVWREKQLPEERV